MKSLKYCQLKEMLLNSETDIFKIPKKEVIKFCKEQKNKIPENIYETIIEIINDVYDE